MDSVSFCNMLKEARALSGISMVELCYKLNKSPTAVQKLFSSKSDSGMNKYIEYVRAIDAEILLSKENTTIAEIHSNQELTGWIMKVYPDYSSVKLGEELEMSQPAALKILKGGTIRLSLFLKIANKQGLKIDVQPIPYYDTASVDDCDLETKCCAIP